MKTVGHILKQRSDVSRIKKGDNAAWLAIFDECFWPLVRFSRLELHRRGNNDPHTAQEVAQRVLCSLLPGFQSWVAEYEPATDSWDRFLQKLALRVIPTYERARVRAEGREQAYARGKTAPAGLTETEAANVVCEIIEICTPREKAMLWHLIGKEQGLDFATISEENAWQLVHRVREKIQAEARKTGE